MTINQVAIMHLRVVKTSMMTTYLSNIPDELKQLKTGACGSLKSVMVNVQIPLMQKLVSLLNQMIKAHGLVMKQQSMLKASTV